MVTAGTAVKCESEENEEREESEESEESSDLRGFSDKASKPFSTVTTN